SRPNANGPKPRVCICVSALNPEIGILNWILTRHVAANKTVTHARFINDSRIEDMDVLKRYQAVVLCQIGPKPRDIGAAGREGQELRRIREEESHRYRVLFADAVVNVCVELIFVIKRGGRSGVVPVWMGRRNQILPVWKSCVQHSERDRID